MTLKSEVLIVFLFCLWVFLGAICVACVLGFILLDGFLAVYPVFIICEIDWSPFRLCILYDIGVG